MWTAALSSFPCLESLKVKSTSLGYAPQPSIDSTDILRVVKVLGGVAAGLCVPCLCMLKFVSVVVDESIVDPVVRMLERRNERGAVPLKKLILKLE